MYLCLFLLLIFACTSQLLNIILVPAILQNIPRAGEMQLVVYSPLSKRYINDLKGFYSLIKNLSLYIIYIS